MFKLNYLCSLFFNKDCFSTNDYLCLKGCLNNFCLSCKKDAFIIYDRKPSLDIAGIGHRTISFDREQLKIEIKNILKEYDRDYRVVVRTALAPGADQLIAECALELGMSIKAVLPFPVEEYIQQMRLDAEQNHRVFTDEDECRFRHLIALTATCKELRSKDNPYLAASQYLINHCDKVIVLWDGVETPLEDEHHNPINQGGTYHCIHLAQEKGLIEKKDIHILKCKR